MSKRIVLIYSWALASSFCMAQADPTFGEGPAAVESAPVLPQISVGGKYFVNPDGEMVIFRGLALADPYVLNRDGQWNREHLEEAKRWNANIVRLPVHPEYWRAAGEEAYLEMIDQCVQWAGELGMYVIIDWHTIGNPLTDVYHRPMYITDKGETMRFWYTIASRYEKNPVVAMYELFNEPTNRNGRMGRLTWAAYKEYIEGIISMIRHIDETAICLVGGFNFAYLLDMARDDLIAYPNVAYVAHPYPQKREAPWVDDWERDWGFIAEKAPLICTEFGFMSADGLGAHRPVIADEVYGEAIIKYFEDRQISWTPWVFHPTWSPQLISDWDYTPTAQGAFFKQKLQELNK